MKRRTVAITLWLVLVSVAGYPADEEISITAWTIWQAVQHSETETALSIRTLCSDWAENRFKKPIWFLTQRGTKGLILLGAFADDKFCTLKSDGIAPKVQPTESSPATTGKYQFLHCAPDKELMKKLVSVGLDNRDKLGAIAARHGFWASVRQGHVIFTPKHFRMRMDDAAFKQALERTLGQLPADWENELTSKAYKVRQALYELFCWSPLGKWRSAPRSLQWRLAENALTAHWTGRDGQVLLQIKMMFF